MRTGLLSFRDKSTFHTGQGTRQRIPGLSCNYVAEERQKALFLTRIGQAAYSKLKTLVSPTLMADLTLEQIVEKLASHYKPDPVEIAERFKFFKRLQGEKEVASFPGHVGGEKTALYPLLAHARAFPEKPGNLFSFVNGQ